MCVLLSSVRGCCFNFILYLFYMIKVPFERSPVSDFSFPDPLTVLELNPRKEEAGTGKCSQL